MTMRITPSILNADLANLAGEIARIPSADAVHLATAVLNRCDWFVTLDKDYQKVNDLRIFSIDHLRDGPAALPWDLPGQDPLFDPQSNVMPISSPKR